MKRFLALAIALSLATCGWAGRTAAQGTPMPSSVEVTGKLVKVMAIGGESTGWAIELESEQSFGGKPVKTVEVEGKVKNLTKLENKKVTASGSIVHRSGVEAGDRAVLEVQKIKEWKEAKPPSEPKSTY